MTAAQRTTIRAAIDAHQRQLVSREAVARGCAGCGCARENRTAGCKPCNDRWNRRARREDPAKRARDNATHLASKRRARERRRAQVPMTSLGQSAA